MDVQVIWIDDKKMDTLARKRGWEDDECESQLTFVQDDEAEMSKSFRSIRAAQRWAKKNAGLDYWSMPSVSVDGERLDYNDPDIEVLALRERMARGDTVAAISSSTMKLHELRRAKGENRYCGPAVMSFVLGVSTKDAASMLRQVSGLRAVKGTTEGQVRKAFSMHGVSMEKIETFEDELRPTLAAWIRETARPAGRLYLVVAGKHWQLIMGRRYACGRIGAIVPVNDPRIKRRARVATVFVLSKRGKSRP